jgi:3-oxoacyl-[acyl-carrier protein] reductase
VVGSKAALHGLTLATAHEGAKHNVRCNMVSPGYVASGDPQVLATQVPLGRSATVEEVAGVVHFLSSPAAAYITGATIHVNGGMYMG